MAARIKHFVSVFFPVFQSFPNFIVVETIIYGELQLGVWASWVVGRGETIWRNYSYEKMSVFPADFQIFYTAPCQAEWVALSVLRKHPEHPDPHFGCILSLCQLICVKKGHFEKCTLWLVGLALSSWVCGSQQHPHLRFLKEKLPLQLCSRETN